MSGFPLIAQVARMIQPLPSNDSIDNSILDSEVNKCGIISIPIIDITFDNEQIHVFHDIPKRYIYGLINISSWKKNQELGNGQIGWTQCHVHSPGSRDDNIYLQDSMNGPIKSGLGNLMYTTMRPEVWLVVVSCNTQVQEIFLTITQVDLKLR